MATALQRSSVSFRRQGSSGRVWDNLQVDRKVSSPLSVSGPLLCVGATGSGPLTGSETAARSQDLSHKHIETYRESKEFQAYRDMSNSGSSTTPMPPSKSQSKDQRCSVFSLFRHCVGSPTAN
ncbi:conserved hypothetical protein [Ricinus communis]|uniref:Uncharacterized protein n=1 Tax=Ricinus communis TaxID=3988 RepID=B9RUJ0_RICCO|nr:conserved hypothetical protein [Ricinus communis]|eukprot:XP_025012806.1 uncharacterized protein LOC112534590 [Ricinus communis]